MKVYIEKQLDGKYTICESTLYTQVISQVVLLKQGNNIFGEKLPNTSLNLEHRVQKYKSGEALSSSMSYQQCLEMIAQHQWELNPYPHHVGVFTTLDTRFYRTRV